MAYFLRNNDDEALEENRYYWKIKKLLQDISSRNSHGVLKTFKLHSKTWQNNFTVFDDASVRVHTKSFNGNYVDHLFDFRAGIVGDDLKEIVVVTARSMNKLISRSELDSFLLSNKVSYLFVEIRRKDENVQKIKSRKQQIRTHYRDLLLSGRNSDVILTVKHKKFYCHRGILAARSPVFSEMMKNNMEEIISGELIIEDTDPGVFQKFLLFLYTGNDDYLCWQNVTDLYNLADKYKVEMIKFLCRNDIKENINMVNFCALFKLSALHNDPEITETIVQFFLKHSKDIVECKNWTTFLSENSKEWLSVDHIKEKITTENFFLFFMLYLMQNDSHLSETTVQFFLKNSKDIIRSENWMTFQAENQVECNVLIRALADK